ncbi:MAG TPA: hypothetical protein VF209_01310 [Patescibacteria group bacterium]
MVEKSPLSLPEQLVELQEQRRSRAEEIREMVVQRLVGRMGFKRATTFSEQSKVNFQLSIDPELRQIERTISHVSRELQNHTDMQQIASLLKDKAFLIEVAQKTHQRHSEISSLAPETSQDPAELDILFDQNSVGIVTLQEGIGVMVREGQTVREAIAEIATGTLKPHQADLLARISHALWMKNQLVMGTETEKADFKPYNLLDGRAKSKAFDQAVSAAQVLAAKMNVPLVQTASPHRFSANSGWDELTYLEQGILKNKAKILEFASAADQGYYDAYVRRPEEIQGVYPETVLQASHLEAYIAGDENIRRQVAFNSVGFISLLTGLSYLETQGKSAQEVIESIVNESDNEPVDIQVKELLCRLAHAGWLNDQSWKDRETTHRDINMFDLLDPGTKYKDWVQIKFAARVLNKYFKQPATVVAEPAELAVSTAA